MKDYKKQNKILKIEIRNLKEMNEKNLEYRENLAKELDRISKENSRLHNITISQGNDIDILETERIELQEKILTLNHAILLIARQNRVEVQANNFNRRHSLSSAIKAKTLAKGYGISDAKAEELFPNYAREHYIPE